MTSLPSTDSRSTTRFDSDLIAASPCLRSLFLSPTPFQSAPIPLGSCAALSDAQDVGLDAAAHPGHRGLLGVPRQVRITRRAPDIGVPEKPPDHGQALAERQGPAGEGMPQIVDPHVFHPGPRPHATPVRGELRQMPVRLSPANTQELRGTRSIPARTSIAVGVKGTMRAPVLASLRLRRDLIYCKRTIIFVVRKCCNQDECGFHQSTDPPWTQLAPDGNAVARNRSGPGGL